MSVWDQYARVWNTGVKGFGIESYNAARAAGLSNAQIQSGTAGRLVGRRATDMINAGISTENALAGQIRSAQNEAAGYKSQLSGYESQLSNYRGQLDNYMNQVNNLSSQYQTALSRQQEIQSEADKWQSDFRDMSSKYETEKAEADRYRNEAVGRQLQGVRSGSTTSGSQATIGAGQGSLTGGGQRFQSDRPQSELARMVKDEGGLTDSVLANKGPVVERMTAERRQSPSAGQSSPSLAAGRTSSTSGYYASRFR